jgi:hypothetical protein
MAAYSTHVDELDPPELTVEHSPWTGRARLLVGGVEAERLSGRGQRFRARRRGSGDAEVVVKSAFHDPVPVLVVDGREHRLARPLLWYEYVIGGIPLLLLFVGGALGALAGVLAAYANFRILRGDRPGAIKGVLVLLTTAAAAVAYLIGVVLLQVLLGRV